MRTWRGGALSRVVIMALGLGAPVYPAQSQEVRRTDSHVRAGVGAFLPGEDLPSRDTPWGVGQGRFGKSLLMFIDYARGAEWAGFAGFAHLMAAPVTVEWRTGDNSLAGLTGAGLVGLQHSIALGDAARLFVRAGVGSAFHMLKAGSACIPEDPVCGLSWRYAENHLDMATHAGAGLEVRFAGLSLSGEIGSVTSRFDAGDVNARQHTTTILMGIGM